MSIIAYLRAIGDYDAPAGSAAVTLYIVDNIGVIHSVSVGIPDGNATRIYYLAKCCAGEPEYLLAGVGDWDILYSIFT